MKVLLLTLLIVFVTSCGQENVSEKANSQQQESPALLNTQLDALDKANNVEDSLEKMTEAREQEMRKQGI